MAKIKRWLNDLPICSTFILLTVVFILVALLAIDIEKTFLVNAQRSIAFQYSNIVEGFNGVKVWGSNETFLLLEQDSRLMQLYELLIWILPPFTYLACSFLAGLIFYRSKIKKPLALLSLSAMRIADKDLDFSVHYEKNDEMGALCAAFEKMRTALESNNREMWRQMDERKRLNAAFSHDLRTPLTVLEGHIGILQKHTPDGKLNADDTMITYAIMVGQIDRLKSYISSMNTLQRLEDIAITRQFICGADFIAQLKDTASIICNTKKLECVNEVNTTEVHLDPEIVMQVFENLLSNAVRYAKNSITIKYSVENGAFSICVSDDGAGFSDTALRLGTSPFYSTENNESSGHLGLGLNICEILCRRHGGSITLSNSQTGGAVVTAKFGMGE